MPDDANNPPADGENQEPQKVSLSQEEHAALMEAKGQQDKLIAEAEQYGFDSPRSYVDYLIEIATADKPPPPPPQEPKPKINTEPEYKAEFEERSKKIEETAQSAVRSANQARLDSQWTSFERKREMLPEEQRSSLSREELERYMRSPKGFTFVSNLLSAGEYNGNAYAAATELLDLENAKKKAREEGFTAGQTMKDAAGTASIGTGSIPPPGTKKETKPDEQLADLIAPKAGVFEG